MKKYVSLIVCVLVALFFIASSFVDVSAQQEPKVSSSIKHTGMLTFHNMKDTSDVFGIRGDTLPGIYTDFDALGRKGIPLLGDPSLAYGIIEDFITTVVDTAQAGAYNFRVASFIVNQDSMHVHGPAGVDTAGGVISLSVGGADNDSLILMSPFESFKPDTIYGKGTWFETCISLPDTTQFEWKIGLAEKNTDMTGVSTSGVYFRNLDESNKVILMTDRAGSVDSVTAVSNVKARTWYVIGFYCDGKGTITGYVQEGRTQPTRATALTKISKYTPRTANLALFFLFKAGAAHAARQTVHIDWIKVVQRR